MRWQIRDPCVSGVGREDGVKSEYRGKKPKRVHFGDTWSWRGEVWEGINHKTRGGGQLGNIPDLFRGARTSLKESFLLWIEKGLED